MSQSLTSSNNGAIAAGVAAIACLYLGTIAFRRNRHTPPGPTPLPIVGNWFDLPSSEPWVKYAEWSKRYGSDLVHLNVFGTDLILVNSAEAAKALFETKSALYADRPRMTMLNELTGFSWHFGFMPQGNSQWKTHRRIFANDFNPTSVAQFRPHQLKWRGIFLHNLLDSPDNLVTHIQHLISGVALEAAFGLDVQPSGRPDPFIHAATQAIEGLGAAGLFGAYLVDYLPVLKYLPFGRFQQQAKKWKTSVDIAVTVPFDIVKGAMTKGDAVKPSVASRLIDSQTFNEDDVRQTTSAMFANGSAAAVSALSTFFLAMSLHPEIQTKAQKELDAVLSNTGRKLPEFADEASLPYISAIVKEVLRWNPVVPLAFPHRLTSDDTYNGYHLPAGSVILPNAWAILHDEKAYGADVSSFRPERFLTHDGKPDPHVRSPDVAFGFGRRICPARNMALSELFIFMSSTLAIFNISAKETSPKSVPKYTSGLLRYPMPFDCTIKARSQKHEDELKALASE